METNVEQEASSGTTSLSPGWALPPTPAQKGHADGTKLWSDSLLQPCEKSVNILTVKNIPEGMTERKLSSEMGKIFPKHHYRLVYCDGTIEALLICNNKSDFRDMAKTGAHARHQYEIQPLETQRISPFTAQIRIIPGLELAELHEIGIKASVKNGFVTITAPTYYQILYMKTKVESLKSAKGKEKKGIVWVDITSIKEVNDVVWTVFEIKMERDVKAFKSTEGCSVNRDENSVIIESATEDVAPDVKSFVEYIKKLKDQEGSEDFDIKNADVDKVTGWCKELEDTISGTVCVYVQADMKIIVMYETYDDLIRIKRKMKYFQGICKVKPTGIAQRCHNRGQETPETFLEKSAVEDEMNKIDTNSDRDKGVARFKTKENIKVHVYSSSICRVFVDCIVNATNESMSHGGGVAFAIARAAGQALTDDGDRLINRKGPLKVGHACTTTAGKLPYKCVIHTVGPRWSDYSKKSVSGVQECANHLEMAIMNSFLEAENQGMESIALPAISSAIFGVPKELCVSQYVLTILEYSQKARSRSHALKEIHFVDVNVDMVTHIQKEFDRALVQGQDVSCNLEKYVTKDPFNEYRRSGKVNKNAEMMKVASVPFYTCNEAELNLNAESQQPFGDFIMITGNVSDDDASVFGFKESSLSLYLNGGNIKDVKAEAIVVAVDQTGLGGCLVDALLDKEEKINIKHEVKVKLKTQNKAGSIIVTGGCSTGFQEIVHVVLPVSFKQEKNNSRHPVLKDAYLKIFEEATRYSSLALTVLGIDDDKAEDIRFGAEILYESFQSHCINNRTSKLDVHLVCYNPKVLQETQLVLMKYVKETHIEEDKPTKKFQKEEKKFLPNNKRNISRTLFLGNGKVALSAERNNLQSVSADTIVYLWERNHMHSVGKKDSEILSSLSEENQRYWFNHKTGPSRHDPFFTKAGHLGCQDCLHVPVIYKMKEITFSIDGAIQMADSRKHQSVAIYFDICHPLLKDGKKLTEAVYNALMRVVHDIRYVKVVQIVVDIPECIADQIFDFFQQSCFASPSISPTMFSLKASVTGMKDDIKGVLDSLQQEHIIAKDLSLSPSTEKRPSPKPPSADFNEGNTGAEHPVKHTGTEKQQYTKADGKTCLDPGKTEGDKVSGRKITRSMALGADTLMQTNVATVQHQAKYTLRNIHGIWVIKKSDQIKLRLQFDDPTDVRIEENLLFVDGKLFEIIEDKEGKPCLIPLPQVEITKHTEDFLDRGTMRTTRQPLSAKLHTRFEYVARKISNIWIVTNQSLSRTYRLEFDGTEDIKVEENFLLSGNCLYEIVESKGSPLHLVLLSTAKMRPKVDVNGKSAMANTGVVKTKGEYMIRRLKCGWIITSDELNITFRLPFNDKKDVHMADEFLFVDGQLYEADMDENGELFLDPLALVLLKTTMPTPTISKPVAVDKIRQIGHIWTLKRKDTSAHFQLTFDGIKNVHMADEFIFADGELYEILEMDGNLFIVPLQAVQTAARSYNDETSEDEVETYACDDNNTYGFDADVASDEYTSFTFPQRSHKPHTFGAHKSTAYTKDNSS